MGAAGAGTGRPGHTEAAGGSAASHGNITWVGGAPGGWHNPTNWSPQVVPSAADTASIAGGTVSLTPTSSFAVLNLSGGTLSGTNTTAGVLNWSGGTIDGFARLSLTEEGRLNIMGTGDRMLSGMLTNGGVVAWSAEGSLLLEGGLVQNLAGALFDLRNDRPITYYYTRGFIHNQGVLRKSGGVGTNTVNGNIGFTNAGTLEVQTGALHLNSGTFRDGTRFIGAGMTRLTGGGVSFSGGIALEHVELAGATVYGTSVLSGRLLWSDGTIDTASRVTLEPGATLRLTGIGDRMLYGWVTNHGTVEWANQGRLLLEGGGVHNPADGCFGILTDAAMTYQNTRGTFLNGGILRKTGSAGTNNISAGVNFTNTGTVEVQAGAINFGGGNFLDGSVFTGAGVSRFPGGTVRMNGTIFMTNTELAGAALAGTHTILGALDWTAGNIDGAGRMTIPSNSVLRLAGAAEKTLYGALTNAGLVTWSGSGDVVLEGGAWENLAGATFEILSDRTLRYYGAPGIFRNKGRVLKSGGVGTNTVGSRVSFLNTGTVEVQTGGISFVTGSTFGTGTALVGAGKTVFPSGTVVFNGTVLASNAAVAGATLGGTSLITGELTWTSGTLESSARMTIASSALLELGGAGDKSFQGVLSNAGTVRWTGTGNANWVLCGGRVFNLQGGLIELRTDRPVTSGGCGSPGIENAGVIRKLQSTGTNVVTVTVTNFESVEAQSGTVAFNGGFVQRSGQTTLSGGGLAASSPLLIQGGVLQGAGTISASVVNGGLLAPGNPVGLMTISGNYTQSAAGMLQVELAGVTPVSQHDRLTVAGAVALDGAIAVSPANSYRPSDGAVFQIMSYGSSAGMFTDTNGLRSTEGWELAANYGSNVLTLVSSNPRPQFTRFEYQKQNKQFRLVLAGQAGASYVFQASTNLTTWLPLTNLAAPTGTNEFKDPEATNYPIRFYRAFRP